MGQAALSALQDMFVADRMLFLVFGAVLGLIFGAVPGLGGIVGVAILLPFTFNLDPYLAFAMMIGLIAVTGTSDTITAVLFGVPGTAGSQAIILDGHPMAKNGEAGRAFGAAFTASLLGGVVGAASLALAIPVLRPLVLAFGSPEFFMIGLLGISMVAVVSGNAPIQGMIAGAAGLLLGAWGQDPQTGVPRWTFGEPYLWTGIPIVPAALGLFAVPEITDMLIKGTRIADIAKGALKGRTQGIRDTISNWFLVVRCAGIGVWLGAIPGIGSSVVDWFAYGHAAQTEKGARETFGKGDVRGVIAPDSCTNAKDGGALIPTLAFGVPGSPAQALILAALIVQGLRPGPDMLTTHLDLTFTLVWSLALANVVGAGICLLLANQLARIARLRINYIAPVVLVIVFVAAYQTTRHWGDLWVLMGFGILGWVMKRFGWPRPPLVLGIVLSAILENYLWISTRLYGFGWMTRPIVIVVALLIIASLAYGVRANLRARQKRRAEASEPTEHQEVGP